MYDYTLKSEHPSTSEVAFTRNISRDQGSNNRLYEAFEDVNRTVHGLSANGLAALTFGRSADGWRVMADQLSWPPQP
jgi:hypothetical protein